MRFKIGGKGFTSSTICPCPSYVVAFTGNEEHDAVSVTSKTAVIRKDRILHSGVE
eukprot:CAMPEP_0119188890 /NCGR_PEP_ID=MMETSP1316-20130426/367_1 /TAXON_ID=41880 /ORGANISM="Pycnococcus provasolii, Strain RCC2336" /LENGTH=54 /DNA_ID=CAMNT_0007183413 /DNA_START=111 /DNA_END=275 /DNA_ORIENTATION=+